MKKIPMFNVNNDTDQWLLAVDGFFGYFDSKEEALKIYNLISDIDNSGHGSCQLMPPNTARIDIFTKQKSEHNISDFKSIDIVSYVQKHSDRQFEKHMSAEVESLKHRLNRYKTRNLTDNERFALAMQEFFTDNDIKVGV